MISAQPPEPPRTRAGGTDGAAPCGHRSSAWADRLALIVERLTAAPARAGQTRVLAIDGRSGAGKTTLGVAVQQAFESSLEPGPPIVHLEDLYPGWDGLIEGTTRLLEWVLLPLAAGRPAGYRRYDWDRGSYGPWIGLANTSLLIVEGVGAGTAACAPYISLLVYLDAPEAVRFDRAMARDGDTYRPHWQRWADQEQRLLAADDALGRADIVLSDSLPSLW